MEDPINLCQTCLSVDRHLISTSKIDSILMQIKFKELANKHICWECQSIVLKFFKFKLQVKSVEMAVKKKHKDLKPFTKLSRLIKENYDFKFICNSDSIINKPNDDKPEPNLIKQEICVQEIDYLYDPLINVPIEGNNEPNLVKQELHLNLNESTHEFSSDEEKVFVENIKEANTKDKKKLPKNKTSLYQRKVNVKPIELKEKLKIVVYTEEEMLRSREDKRNHPNYKKIPFKCDTCVLGFVRKDYYELHMKKKHEKIGSYICNICSTYFQSNTAMVHHRESHYCKQVICTVCGYSSSTLRAALLHCTQKHESNDCMCQCTHCNERFRTVEELAEHKRTQHVLKCNDCGVSFKGKHTLRTHRIRIHAVKREFICDICKGTFVNKSRLETHMTQHSGDLGLRLAYCTLCRVQYKNIHVYRNHLRNNINHVKDRYPCTECNKKFASKVYWRKHYNFYHLKKSPYKCEACDKLFISKWRLKNHKQKHHGLSRSRDHACSDCGKKFYTITTLRGHQLTHSEQRQYMCEDCGLTFKQRPALYTHARLVHKVKKCDKKTTLIDKKGIPHRLPDLS